MGRLEGDGTEKGGQRWRRGLRKLEPFTHGLKVLTVCDMLLSPETIL